MNIVDKLKWRYATKLFDSSKKISSANLDILKESMRLAPTSYGMQQLKVLHITNSNLKEAIQDASFGQKQVTTASDLFIIAVKSKVNEKDILNYISLIAQERGVNVDSLEAYKKRITDSILTLTPEKQSEWLFKQSYILLGFLLETAALLEIDACPMEGFDKASVDEILGLEKLGLKSSLIIPVGYRSIEDKFQDNKKTRVANNDFFIEF